MGYFLGLLQKFWGRQGGNLVWVSYEHLGHPRTLLLLQNKLPTTKEDMGSIAQLLVASTVAGS